MNFTEYHAAADATANHALGEKEELTCAALGLTGESGEFADMVKKYLYQGHEFDNEKAVKELGDVLWYLALAASALGVPLELIAERNIEKLKARYGGQFSAEKSVFRAETAQAEPGKPDAGRAD